MSQYELFAGSPPHVAHSDTSRAAAEAIAPKISVLHREILDHLSLVPGATDEEMQHDLFMGPNTQRPRRRELQLMGRIVDSGLRRPTSSGRAAVIWKLAP